jgi:hypothetical protein
MGRATFDSIGHPLANRDTIVLTRDRSWAHNGVRVAHDLQHAIDIAEDLRGDLMVVGGSHLYASAMAVAHMQILSEIHQEPEGDTFYPRWDETDWIRDRPRHHEGFDVIRWHRKPRHDRICTFDFNAESADLWWSRDWEIRLSRAVDAQRSHIRDSGTVNWSAVHQSAMAVIVEAAEDHSRRGPNSAPKSARQVRLSRHLSMQDMAAIQGALLHWSDFIAPRSELIRRSGP